MVRKRVAIPVIILVFLALLTFIGYIGYINYKENEVESENTAAMLDNEINTENPLSPARDLTGIWRGQVAFADNIANPNCSYEGIYELQLTQNENDIWGNSILIVQDANRLIPGSNFPCTPPGTYNQAVAGTVSSSHVELVSGVLEIDGEFTSDLMTVNFQSCPEQRCVDGSLGVGIAGSSSMMRQ